jgi:hypothetical protein
MNAWRIAAGRRPAKTITYGLVAAAVFVSCYAILPQTARPAGRAAVSIDSLVARDVGSLAARIQHDGRRGGSAAMTAVKVIKGCCGVRALEVYERARPGSFARYGVYYLQLVTKGASIQKMAISEFTTKRGYRFGEAYSETPYSIDIGPTQGHWSISVGHAYHPDEEYTTGKVMFHSQEADLTAAELQTLYGQALAVIKKAEDHLPVSDEEYLHPGLPCGVPEHQACEPGGRW